MTNYIRRLNRTKQLSFSCSTFRDRVFKSRVDRDRLSNHIIFCLDPVPLFPAASIWFEIWGSWIRLKNISIFPGKFSKKFVFQAIPHKKFDFFKANFRKIRFFQENFRKISIFQAISQINFDFPGKNNWPFRARSTPEQIILFLFKSLPRPLWPPAQNLGVATPNPRIDAPAYFHQYSITSHSIFG